MNEQPTQAWPDGGHEDLYIVHFAALMRIGFCLTGSNEVAEDLVQDTFLRCSSRLAAVDDPGSYLRAALVNACHSYHRRTQLANKVAVHPPAGRDMPADLVELRDVLLRLPARQRGAIVLRYLVDLDDERIAETLGCRRSTVRSLVRRGLAQLREELP